MKNLEAFDALSQQSPHLKRDRDQAEDAIEDMGEAVTRAEHVAGDVVPDMAVDAAEDVPGAVVGHMLLLDAADRAAHSLQLLQHL